MSGNKKELSYTYWHAAARGDAPLLEPQKLTAEESERLTQQMRTCAAVSAWNTAGTWEERNWTKWAQTRLTELVTGLRTPLSLGGELATTGVSTCTGDATVTTVRGKLRHGFDFDVAVSFLAELPGAEPRSVKGTVQVADASRSAAQDGDVEVCVKVDKATTKGVTDAEARAVTAAAKTLQAQLLKALRQLDADMLARMEEPAPSTA